MDIEGVVFSAGHREALGTYERVLQVSRWAAHLVFIGDHLGATVFTSDTPPRIAARHKQAIEQAVVVAGQDVYLDPLQPQYAGRMSRPVIRYFLDMAREVAPHTREPVGVPALRDGPPFAAKTE